MIFLKYLAHINQEDGREQSLTEHLKGAAKRAEIFASVFGEGNFGKLVGLYHDIGKYSDEFQNYLKNGKGKKVDHSTAGAKEILKLNKMYFPIAFAIASHHTGLINCGSSVDVQSDSTFNARMKRKEGTDFPKYSNYKDELNEPPKSVKTNIVQKLKSKFSVQFYVRMLYSCLVDADFLDTEDFMLNSEVNRGNYPSIEDLKKRFDEYINKRFLSKKNLSEINKKRCEILNECIENGKNSSENIFSLTVPTGGGKTISSMAFALNYAVKNNKKRIIYVIPYTSIIEQNAKVFRDIFGDDAVVEHHSNISYDFDETTDFQKYEILKKAQLATENWDAPIIVTTNVQFFESLFANKSSKCRKLHNIANSVIIFDEAQMLPTSMILPCMNIISELVNLYNAAAVLCTATQPSLEQVFYEISKNNILEICSNIEDNYKFFKRNNIIVLKDEVSVSDISINIKKSKQVLCIVNSKRTAGELYKTLSGEENVFYLSTNLCGKHRTKVIEKIKNLLMENKDCRVISTSLIEAGVDIDFPTVYREVTGLDSIIQSAGRCNREGKFNKTESSIYVFEWSDNELKYKGHDLKPRIGAAEYVLNKNYENLDDLEAIKCYFDFLHKFTGGGLDNKKIMELVESKPCNFKDFAAEFIMIDDATIPVFIPYDDKGAEILNEIKAGNITKNLMRKTGVYMVNVYQNQFEAMLNAHHIEYADDEGKSLAFLCDSKYYDENLGLLQEVKEGEGIFL